MPPHPRDRPALERSLPGDAAPGGEATLIICGDVPYTCDGFDPADWPPGGVPDFTLVREWEARVRGHAAEERMRQ